MSARNNQQQIAEVLGRHKSTMSAEIALILAVEVFDLVKHVCWPRNGL